MFFSSIWIQRICRLFLRWTLAHLEPKRFTHAPIFMPNPFDSCVCRVPKLYQVDSPTNTTSFETEHKRTLDFNPPEHRMVPRQLILCVYWTKHTCSVRIGMRLACNLLFFLKTQRPSNRCQFAIEFTVGTNSHKFTMQQCHVQFANIQEFSLLPKVFHSSHTIVITV